MAYDIFLGVTRKNWARGSQQPPTLLQPKPNLVLTDEERAKLSKLAEVKMRAESGDRSAQKAWKKLRRDHARLRKRAARGDAQAQRLHSVVEESGLFGDFQQKFSMSSGDDSGRAEIAGPIEIVGEFVGDEERAEKEDRRGGRKGDPFSGDARPDGGPRPDPFSDVPRQPLPRKPSPYATSALGSFVGDEARAERESCGYNPTWASRLIDRSRGSRRRRRLNQLAQLAARGDVRAQGRVREVAARLSRRSARGDARAAETLRQIQAAWPGASSAPSAVPYYQPAAPVATPPAAPAPISSADPYAGLPPLPADEEYVQDVYV